MSKKGKTFNIIATIILLVVALFCLMPFVLLISASISDEKSVLDYGYSFLPRKVDFLAYRYIFTRARGILKAYGLSFVVTIIGTAVNLVLTVLYAYPISRSDLKGRNVFSFILFFTILFNGGLLPSYIMWTQTFHIKNSIWAYILPNLMLNGFYVIMARNYFSQNVPKELIECAKLDTAGEYTILFRIVIPISKPILATVGLFVSLNYWNDWQNGLYYITDESKYTIQTLLNRMLLDSMYLQSSMTASYSGGAGQSLPTFTLKMAVAFIGVIPILVIFPFVSKYLTGGMTVGAVKG